MKKRRLAVIDSKFPWMSSGFRYWESYFIQQEKPDTVFFASQPFSDPFPSKIYSVNDFEKCVEEFGITDVYSVFLNQTLSIYGREGLAGYKIPGSNSTLYHIAKIISDKAIRVHTTFYPGGGLEPDTPQDVIRLAGSLCDSVFTNITEVKTLIDKSIYVPVPVNSEFYEFSNRQVEYPIQLVFCAMNAPRKGFPILVEAFNALNDHFHLHIVGDWQDSLHLLENQNYTFHGSLNPLQLRRLYAKGHVFVSCSTIDNRALDGFPTTAAAEAMSTGCILVSSNGRKEENNLVNGKDYFEFSGVHQLIDTLLLIKENPFLAQQVGESGAKKIRSVFDARTVAQKKLQYIFSD